MPSSTCPWPWWPGCRPRSPAVRPWACGRSAWWARPAPLYDSAARRPAGGAGPRLRGHGTGRPDPQAVRRRWSPSPSTVRCRRSTWPRPAPSPASTWPASAHTERPPSATASTITPFQKATRSVISAAASLVDGSTRRRRRCASRPPPRPVAGRPLPRAGGVGVAGLEDSAWTSRAEVVVALHHDRAVALGQYRTVPCRTHRHDHGNPAAPVHLPPTRAHGKRDRAKEQGCVNEPKRQRTWTGHETPATTRGSRRGTGQGQQNLSPSEAHADSTTNPHSLSSARRASGENFVLISVRISSPDRNSTSSPRLPTGWSGTRGSAATSRCAGPPRSSGPRVRSAAGRSRR